MENRALKTAPDTIAKQKARLRPVFLLYALCGILTALPMVFPPLWILSWIAPAPVFAVSFLAPPVKKHPLRRAYGRGLSFFYCWGLVVFYWFMELYPLDFAGLDKWEMCIRDRYPAGGYGKDGPAWQAACPQR